MTTHSDAHEQGFTLLEMLVALALVSMLSLLAFGGLRFAARALEASSTRIGALSDVMAAQRLLRRTIENSAPAPISDDLPIRLDFRGNDASLEFIAPVEHAMAEGGFARYRLWVERNGSVTSLRMSWRFASGALLPGASERLVGEMVLLDHILRARIGFFGPPSAGQLPAWSASWPQKDTLPQLVRIDVEFAPDDRRRWPSLILAPRIDADGSCIFDSVSLGCRGRT